MFLCTIFNFNFVKEMFFWWPSTFYNSCSCHLQPVMESAGTHKHHTTFLWLTPYTHTHTHTHTHTQIQTHTLSHTNTHTSYKVSIINIMQSLYYKQHKNMTVTSFKHHTNTFGSVSSVDSILWKRHCQKLDVVLLTFFMHFNKCLSSDSALDLILLTSSICKLQLCAYFISTGAHERVSLDWE